jgi:nicotinamidase/pyrazinamidase
VGTDGEAFHPNLDPQPFNAVFLKGEREAAYSGFEGRHVDGSSLTEWLTTQEVTDIDVCGLTTDHCVRETSLDGIRNGFNTRVLIDLCAGVLPRTTDAAIQAMRSAGVKLT